MLFYLERVTMNIYLNDDIERMDEEQTMALINTLPEWRRQRALRFKHLAGRRECAVAYSLLCQALREVYGIHEAPHFDVGEHGKPTLRDYPHIHFNMSHCQKAVICVISDAPIGVDIERVRKQNASLTDYTMNEEEIEQIEASDQPEMMFTRLWTAKEAVLKLQGTGIQDTLKDSLKLALEQGITVTTYENNDKGYAYSIATR